MFKNSKVRHSKVRHSNKEKFETGSRGNRKKQKTNRQDTRKIKKFAEYFLGHDKLVIRHLLVQYGNILLVPDFPYIFLA